ncbi:AmmeMemoRadiSam system protein A [Candidatus Parcubacteria bacterium]|nr:AmmeMemoRadiSam system protein A [Candidatus Parcubacteria bacterium]
MDKYVKLAKKAAEEYIKNKKIIALPTDLPSEFYRKTAGIFVTIHNQDELRGCIGTCLPAKDNIGQEIIDNAVSACSSDYRFYQITEDELQNLKYEVSVLSEPRLIGDIKKHNPKKCGIIAECGDGRAGLLLPDLDGIDSADQQIEIACKKGEINPQAGDIKLYCFTVEKHS